MSEKKARKRPIRIDALQTVRLVQLLEAKRDEIAEKKITLPQFRKTAEDHLGVPVSESTVEGLAAKLAIEFFVEERYLPLLISSANPGPRGARIRFEALEKKVDDALLQGMDLEDRLKSLEARSPKEGGDATAAVARLSAQLADLQGLVVGILAAVRRLDAAQAAADDSLGKVGAAAQHAVELASKAAINQGLAGATLGIKMSRPAG